MYSILLRDKPAVHSAIQALKDYNYTIADTQGYYNLQSTVYCSLYRDEYYSELEELIRLIQIENKMSLRVESMTLSKDAQQSINTNATVNDYVESNDRALKVIKTSVKYVIEHARNHTLYNQEASDFLSNDLFTVAVLKSAEKKSMTVFVQPNNTTATTMDRANLFELIICSWCVECLSVPQFVVDILYMALTGTFERDVDVFLQSLNITDLARQRVENILTNTFTFKDYNRNKTQQIERFRHDIYEYQRQIEVGLQSIRRLELEIMEAVTGKAEEAVKETMDFLFGNKHIQNISMDGGTMKFSIVTPLRYYETDILEKYMELNNGNYLNSMSDEMKRLYRAIFIKKDYELNVCVTFIFSVENLKNLWLGRSIGFTNIISISASSTSNCMKYKAMPNLHLTQYQCYGAHKDTMFKALTDGDLVQTFATLIASVQNINFADSTVGRAFIQYILSNKRIPMFIEKSTKTIKTLEEVLDETNNLNTEATTNTN